MNNYKGIKYFLSVMLLFQIAGQVLNGQNKPDAGAKNEFYSNPILHADYSDPDVIRVGDDYFLVSSSFSNFPGLPVLQSEDLINWRIICNAVEYYPAEGFEKPGHGNGIWAPSIRYNNGEFYIYFGDPDNGIFMTKAKEAHGPWSPLRLIKKAKGWIDPCPFWDDDGNAYLIHAWANSRAGIKSILTLNKMNYAGTEITDEGMMIFDGRNTQPTIEGPKLYKHNGYYYIFAPAGGVKQGWQTVLRSNNIYGPYEEKIVLEQGGTKINGPHQGAWITTRKGEDWFIHFQDKGAYGRIIYLEPLKWENNWPAIGIDYDKNGIGEPVAQYKLPCPEYSNGIETLASDDKFNNNKLGLQWQWQANYKNEWYSLEANSGYLRLFCIPLHADCKNLYDAPNLLMQKFPAELFKVSAKIKLNGKAAGDKAGLIIFGTDYAYIAVEKTEKGFKITEASCLQADKGSTETVDEGYNIRGNEVVLYVSVAEGAVCSFAYSEDGIKIIPAGKPFIAKPGRWIGAKTGLFALSKLTGLKNSFADIDWFNVEK